MRGLCAGIWLRLSRRSVLFDTACPDLEFSIRLILSVSSHKSDSRVMLKHQYLVPKRHRFLCKQRIKLQAAALQLANVAASYDQA